LFEIGCEGEGKGGDWVENPVVYPPERLQGGDKFILSALRGKEFRIPLLAQEVRRQRGETLEREGAIHCTCGCELS